MHQFEDRRVRSVFPKMRGRTVVYLGDASDFPGGMATAFRRRFEAIGYRFIVLSELLNDLLPLAFEGLFPGTEGINPQALERQIRVQTGIGGEPGFLYKKSRWWYFRFRGMGPGKTPAEEAEALLEQLRAETRRIRFSSRPRKRDARKFEDEVYGAILPTIRPKRQEESIIPAVFDELEREEPESTILFRDADFSVGPDPHTQEVLTEINRILEKYNLTVDELEIILGYTVKLSRMKITRTGQIFMTDFENKEIKMDHLTKMVYFFYLRHPEGVRFKEVDSHLEELLHIYMGITGRDDPEAIRRSVTGHVAPYGSGLNISASRIKTAFKDALGEKVAKFYWLQGKKGEPYSIAIDRDFVIWEYPE